MIIMIVRIHDVSHDPLDDRKIGTTDPNLGVETVNVWCLTHFNPDSRNGRNRSQGINIYLFHD